MGMIAEILSYPFLVRALAVGVFVSLCASLLGVSLVLRRFSMIGDGLSHVGFGALGVAAFLSLPPLYVTLPVVIIAAFLLLRLSESRHGGDGSIAIISSGALAIGVVAISVKGVNTDLNSFLFGSILSVSESDAIVSVVLSAVTLFVYIVFYHQIFATTFDPVFSKATGMRNGTYTTVLSLLTALTVVVGMRLLGSLLISSLIIFPSMTARKLLRTYRGVCIFSALESVIAFMIGFVLSYAFSLPTGASIVLVHLMLYIAASAYGFLSRARLEHMVRKKELQY